VEHRYKTVVSGKFLRVSGEDFLVRGVAYGTFAPRRDGHQFPESLSVRRDFDLMRAAGINTVRTYLVPPLDVLDIAAETGLRVMAGVSWPQHVAFLDTHSLRRNIIRSIGDQLRPIGDAALDADVDRRLLSRDDDVVANDLGETDRADAKRIPAGSESINAKGSVGFRERAAGERRIPDATNGDRTGGHRPLTDGVRKASNDFSGAGSGSSGWSGLSRHAICRSGNCQDDRDDRPPENL